jgi:protein-tyrosine phosphatase
LESTTPQPRSPGRIDVHAHLIPDVDDGCRGVAESIDCGRVLAANGYTHAFCTPHVWPSLPAVTRESVPKWTADLQRAFDAVGVGLTLLPGGELNLHADVRDTPPEQLITPGLGGRYILCDMWAERIPHWFEKAVRWLQKQGLTVILAHPERMRAVQDDPDVVAEFEALDILLQGNLQCFADRPGALTRGVAEKYLSEGRYFLLGSDTHNPQSMPIRMAGLKRAVELVGEDAVNVLTMENPRKLMPPDLAP